MVRFFRLLTSYGIDHLLAIFFITGGDNIRLTILPRAAVQPKPVALADTVHPPFTWPRIKINILSPAVIFHSRMSAQASQSIYTTLIGRRLLNRHL
jgi:hypothetical protein